MTASLNFSKDDPLSDEDVASWLANTREKLLIEARLEQKRIETLQNDLIEEQKRLDVTRMQLELAQYRLDERTQRLEGMDDDAIDSYVSRSRCDSD